MSLRHNCTMLFLYGVAFAMGIVLGQRSPVFYLQSVLCAVFFVLRMRRMRRKERADATE